MRLRIFEMGVSYYGRTYEEGKKIGMKDGFRALYCVFRYNLHTAPVPIQFFTYLIIGAAAAIVNYVLFVLMYAGGWSVTMAAPTAFILASVENYYLSVKLLFRHTARWNSAVEILMYCVLVCLVALLDLGITQGMISMGTNPGISKLTATAAGTGIGVDFQIDGAVLAPSDARAQVRGGTPQSSAIGTKFGDALAVFVGDSTGAPAGNVRVDFDAPASGASCLFSNRQAHLGVLTDRYGLAAAICTANTATGAFVVTAAPLGIAASLKFALTNTAPQLATNGVVSDEAGLRALAGDPARVAFRPTTALTRARGSWGR